MLISHHFGEWTSKFSPLCWFCESAHKSDFVNFNMHNMNLISYYASFSFVSMPLKRDNVLLRDTMLLAWMTLSIVILQGLQTHSGCVAALSFFYIYCKCLLQTFSKFLALVNCAHAFAMMIYYPPSANPAVYNKLLDVVIHLAASVGTIIHKYAVRVKLSFSHCKSDRLVDLTLLFNI